MIPLAALERDVDPQWVLAYLDEHASTAERVEAELMLGDGGLMMVRAGGAGTLCSPPLPPFLSYEVILDHGSAPFWARFAVEEARVVYKEVPKLLVAHHITRHGGISDMILKIEPMDGQEVDEGLMISLDVKDPQVRRHIAQILQEIASKLSG